MQQAHLSARQNLKQSAKRQKHYYDKGVKIHNFQTGQKVWRWYPPSGDKKLGHKWLGPYQVVKKFNEIHYEIKKNDSKPVRVHIDHLKPYYSNIE